MTTLRRLERRFSENTTNHKNMTVGGVLQEMLGRMPEVGDACNWGPFHFREEIRCGRHKKWGKCLRLQITGNGIKCEKRTGESGAEYCGRRVAGTE